MLYAHQDKTNGMASMWRNFKKLVKISGMTRTVAVLMILCVILPTLIIQGAFTAITAWEILLTILLCLSLHKTSEES